MPKEACVSAKSCLHICTVSPKPLLLTYTKVVQVKWASTWDFQQCGMCDQQSLRSSPCAYAQSDQSLCLSLEYPMSVKLLTEHHLEFRCLNGGCTGSSESRLVKIPHCWKSHVAAHIDLFKTWPPRSGYFSLCTNRATFKNSSCQNLLGRFKMIWHKGSLSDPLPRILKLYWFVEKHSRQGAGHFAYKY